jgi:hypothetical protein
MVSRIKADQRIRQNALQEKRATPNHALEMRKMDHAAQEDGLDETDEGKHACRPRKRCGRP